tara:strand:+ start:2435 stop:3349 length:915 start_codon:yes stop_codon:yes gene_type:complete
MAEQSEAVKEEEGQEIVLEESAEEKPSQEEMDLGEPKEQVEAKEEKSSDEELDTYSKNVQARIKKLTEKYRQEERDKLEAVRMSQQLLDENKNLKTRVSALDKGYLNEYGTRLQSQAEMARAAYKEAHEAGDVDALTKAQQLMSTVAAEQQRYADAKARADYQAKMAPVQQSVPQQTQVQQPQQTQRPDPKAESWAQDNSWFGEDKIMTAAAFTIHETLAGEEGFDPNSDEYYTELNRRMRVEFPHKFQTAKKSGGGNQVASAGSSASRSTKQGRRTVKLSPSQIAIAKKLNVPLEEYAKYVKE